MAPDYSTTFGPDCKDPKHIHHVLPCYHSQTRKGKQKSKSRAKIRNLESATAIGNERIREILGELVATPLD